MLNLNAFESGTPFEQQLIEDESLLTLPGLRLIPGVATATRCRGEIALVVFETWKVGVAAPY